MNRLVIHGARGSFPVSGPGHRRYGGNTPCVSLETSAGMLILDAGSGIGHLADALRRRRQLPSFTFLFTHFHLDHVMGLPAFWPFYERSAGITLMADSRRFPGWQKQLQNLFQSPRWPASPFKARAPVHWRALPRPPGVARIYGVRISSWPVRHPQGGASYRLETPAGSLVLATDREEESPAAEKDFARFSRGADLLIHDAQYTPEEYPKRHGWGHSTWRAAAAVANKAGVKRLILTSHDPGRSDVEIDSILRQTKRLFRKTRAACEGMSFSSFR
ncbi:MAG: MBL fold metallo-hydrolase [Candidatus Omnitrophica bacterium]|nr:MBL fold metallo-hydrolase [Candidatus Omnitrophota bacterium]